MAMRYSQSMPYYELSSPSNEKIKRLVNLRERKHRDAEGLFIVEGVRLFSRAIVSGLEPVEVYYDPGQVDAGSHPGAVSTSPQALQKASYRSKSEGLIAVFPQMDLSLESLQLPDNPLILIGEGIEKPGNLGAMLRTADAVGAAAFVAVDSRIDPFNPNAVRASTGALFTVPLASADFASVHDWLQTTGIKLIAASPDAKTDIWNADLTGPVGLLIGSEAEGLSAVAVEAAETLVRIPMGGAVDSLNSSVAFAVLAYETVRQRSV
jgi:TrmH family RNA methyltransferase